MTPNRSGNRNYFQCIISSRFYSSSSLLSISSLISYWPTVNCISVTVNWSLPPFLLICFGNPFMNRSVLNLLFLSSENPFEFLEISKAKKTEWHLDENKLKDLSVEPRFLVFEQKHPKCLSIKSPMVESTKFDIGDDAFEQVRSKITKLNHFLKEDSFLEVNLKIYKDPEPEERKSFYNMVSIASKDKTKIVCLRKNRWVYPLCTRMLSLNNSLRATFALEFNFSYLPYCDICTRSDNNIAIINNFKMKSLTFEILMAEDTDLIYQDIKNIVYFKSKDLSSQSLDDLTKLNAKLPEKIGGYNVFYITSQAFFLILEILQYGYMLIPFICSTYYIYKSVANLKPLS